MTEPNRTIATEALRKQRLIETKARDEGMQWMLEHVINTVDNHRNGYAYATKGVEYIQALDWVLSHLRGTNE